MAPEPKISVVLPVYNGAQWLAGAIECVLAQTFEDFELIVLDDGSRDDSWGVITGFRDSRIRAIQQANMGLAATLNIGLRLANTPYVARQDQDDWMHPERLARQFAYMEANPGCAALGTWAEIRQNDQATGRFHKHPANSDALRLFLLFDNPFVHSSMILRRSHVLALGGYCEDRSRQPPEDYELWARLATDHAVANIPEMLTAYREVTGSMSRTGVSPFRKNVLNISAEALFRTLAGSHTQQQCRGLAALYHGERSTEMRSISRTTALAMLRKAALAVAGDPASWSGECRALFAQLEARFLAQNWRRHIPPRLLAMARRIRRIPQTR